MRRQLPVILCLLVSTALPGLSQEKKGVLPEISLELPRAEQLFRVQSEASLRQEIVAATQVKVLFPADAQPAAMLVDWSDTPAATMLVPSSKVCFRTLYFQDVRTERHLKSWGVVEPMRSAFLFYGRGLAFPALMVCVPPWHYQCWDYAASRQLSPCDR